MHYSQEHIQQTTVQNSEALIKASTLHSNMHKSEFLIEVLNISEYSHREAFSHFSNLEQPLLLLLVTYSY